MQLPHFTRLCAKVFALVGALVLAVGGAGVHAESQAEHQAKNPAEDGAEHRAGDHRFGREVESSPSYGRESSYGRDSRSSDRPGDDDTARRAPRAIHVANSGMSLDQAVSMVEKRYKARVVRTEVRTEGDRKIYVLRLLNDAGRVWTVRVDASSGSVS